MNLITLFQNTNQKTRSMILAVSILILGVIVGGLIWMFSTGKLIREEALEMGQTARLGSLEITFYDFKESSYLSREIDENYQRISKKYLAARIKVFNVSGTEPEKLSISLIDDRGNEYPLDYTVSLYVPDLKSFGRNMTIYPSTFQEGYVFFSGIDERAKRLQLVFTLEATKEKVAFKINK